MGRTVAARPGLPPLPKQLRRAEEHARQTGGRLAWVLFDEAEGKTLADEHPLTHALITLAWESREEATVYQRLCGLGLWRVWPVNSTLLDLGSREESQKTGQRHEWQWKRDRRLPRVAIDYIDPYTGEIRRAGWGQSPVWPEPTTEPAPTWDLDQLADLIGLALMEESIHADNSP